MSRIAMLRASLLCATACVALAGCAEGPDGTAGAADQAGINAEPAPTAGPEAETETETETETDPDGPDPDSADREGGGMGEATSPPAAPGLGAALPGGEETDQPDPAIDPTGGSTSGPTSDPAPVINPFDIETPTDEPDGTASGASDPEADSIPDGGAAMPSGGAAGAGDGSADRADADASPPTHAPDGTPYCD